MVFGVPRRRLFIGRWKRTDIGIPSPNITRGCRNQTTDRCEDSLAGRVASVLDWCSLWPSAISIIINKIKPSQTLLQPDLLLQSVLSVVTQETGPLSCWFKTFVSNWQSVWVFQSHRCALVFKHFQPEVLWEQFLHVYTVNNNNNKKLTWKIIEQKVVVLRNLIYILSNLAVLLFQLQLLKW